MAPARVLVGVDATTLAVWSATTPLRRMSPADAARLRDSLGLRGRVAATVVTAGDVTVHWVQQPPAGVRSLRELQAVAAARCAHLFGGAPSHWWIAGDWHASRPFVCAGVARTRVDALAPALAAADLLTDWHSAWALMHRHHAAAMTPHGWNAVRGPTQVMLWCCVGGQVRAIHSFAAPRDATRADIDARIVQRQRLESLADADVAAAPADRVHWLPPGPWPEHPPEAGQALVSEAEAAVRAALPPGVHA